MAELLFREEKLRDTVRGWLTLDSIEDLPCTVTDCPTGNEVGALVVLYRDEAYLSGAIHESLGMTHREHYVALGVPFSFRELSNAVRRVTESFVRPSAEENAPSREELILSPATHSVSVGEKAVLLSPREFSLFCYLAAHRGETVTRAELFRKAWKGEVSGDANAVDVYIGYLRRKTEPLLGKGAIVSVRGVGYTMVESVR